MKILWNKFNFLRYYHLLSSEAFVTVYLALYWYLQVFVWYSYFVIGNKSISLPIFEKNPLFEMPEVDITNISGSGPALSSKKYTENYSGVSQLYKSYFNLEDVHYLQNILRWGT